MLGALGSPVGEVRAETARTVTGLAHVWLGSEEDKEEGRKDQGRQGDNASSSSASGDDGDGDDSTAFDDAAAFTPAEEDPRRAFKTVLQLSSHTLAYAVSQLSSNVEETFADFLLRG